MVKFGGSWSMKKLVGVIFKYDDGTADEINDPRAALLFQSRANSGGLLSGLEDHIVPTAETAIDESEQHI